MKSPQVPRLQSLMDAGVSRLRTTEWSLWLGIACLLALGLPFALQVWNAWQEQTVVRGTVTEFFQAVADGRRDDALSRLADVDHFSGEKGVLSPFIDEGKSMGDVAIQVSEVNVDAKHASARVVISKDGFSLKPTVSLIRETLGPWRITRIDGVAVDPRWTRLQDGKLREADEALADELGVQLGVSKPAE